MNRYVPNAITVVGAFLTSLAVVLMRGSPAVVIALLVLGQLCDVADGWVARTYDISSRFGAELDLTCDRVLTHVLGIAVAGYVWLLCAPLVVLGQVRFQRRFSGRAAAALALAFHVLGVRP